MTQPAFSHATFSVPSSSLSQDRRTAAPTVQTGATRAFLRALVSVSLSTLLVGMAACGEAPEESRSQPQAALPEAKMLPSDRESPTGGGMDFTLNKPLINRIWGSGEKDVWAAGNEGMMLHWNGKTWRRIAVPTGVDLQGIWGASDKDIWAVGDAGVVIHWDGRVWGRVTTPVPDTAALNDIWGTSGSNIWAVGDRGVVIQYNGSGWGAYDMPAINNLLTVWTPSTSDGWIGGDLGMLLRWDGTNWNEVQSSSAAHYLHIRGVSANRVYAAKQGNEIWQFDGTKWARVSSVYGTRLWMTADNDIWVCGTSDLYRWNGTMWLTYTIFNSPIVWTPAPGKGWAFTSSSSILSFNGTMWSGLW
jgi:hypothetical protein